MGRGREPYGRGGQPGVQERRGGEECGAGPGLWAGPGNGRDDDREDPRVWPGREKPRLSCPAAIGVAQKNATIRADRRNLY